MVTVSRPAARVAGQVKNATVRLGLEVLPAQEVPRARVAQLARQVDKAVVLARVDGPAELAGHSQAAAERLDPEVFPAQEAPPEVVAPPPLVAAWLRVEF